MNGYNDWFLPSSKELEQLRIRKNLIGGGLSGVFWSSTSDLGSYWGSNYAVWQNFGSCTYCNGSAYKNSVYKVRAVRAF